MVSVLVSALSRPGLSPGQAHCITVFLAKTINLTMPLSTQELKCMAVN